MGLKSKAYLEIRKHFLVFFVISGMAVFLPGCGKDEAVETGAAVQENDAAQEDGAAEGNMEEEAVQDDGSESNMQEAQEQTNAARAQLEIDQGLRDELTAELLEENSLDTSVMESGHSTKGCTFDLPEGFTESEEMAGMYVTDRYPIDASSIYYMEAEQDKTLQLLTEETFCEQAQESLREAYGEEITVNVDSFERIKIDGYPAFRILCHYQIGRIQITQLEYAINADKSYMITYSQTSDYDYMEAYEASAETIRVEK